MGRYFTARVEFGQDLGTTDYVLAAAIQRSGCHAYLSIESKDSTGFTAYVVTTGAWSYEAFTVNWIAVVA